MKTSVINKCLEHLTFRIILLLYWSYKGLAQNTLPSKPSTFSSQLSSTSFNSDPSTWTFTDGGYIAVYPVLLSNQNPDFKLSFRTRSRHGILFCHILKDTKSSSESLPSYEFCVELHEGSLRVRQHLDTNTESVLVEKALDNDRWHSLEIQLLTSGKLVLTLDGTSHTDQLTSPHSVLDWNTISSVMLFGGKDGESQTHHFIGCIKDIQIINENRTYSLIANPVVTGSVQTGCQDKCINEEPCVDRTPCTNYYSHVTCNCYGTDRQGQFCEQKGSTKITLRGYEWITYRLYDRAEDRVFSDHNIFSLQFKSDRGSGVLIYAVGSYPHDCHVIASVHEGVVTVSVGFKNDVLEADLGVATDDYRQDVGWHNLTIKHDKNTVSFILDDEVKVKSTDSSDYFLSLDPDILFGGGDKFVITKGLQVKDNFVGCMKNVYVNDVSVVYDMKHGSEKVIHRGGHTPQYGCHKVENIPLSFPKSGTMIVTYTPSFTDLQVQFSFRTVRDMAILFGAQISSWDHFGFLEIWIRDHQVIIEFPSSSNTEMLRNIVIDRIVNDNKWHSLHLNFTDKSTYIKIDGLSKRLNHTEELQLTGKMVIGYGLRQTYGDHDGFVGCIRNIVINNETQDAINLLQRHWGIYGVILDGCNLVPHCQSGPHCEHGGKCLSDWNGISCDCSKTAYEGNACHFAKYKTSCESYYQAGFRETGAYQIDLDGTGPSDPMYVWCVMDYIYHGEKYGMTKIDHNFIPNTQVRGKDMYDMRKLISYRGMTRELLVMLTQKALWCEQLIEYDCYSAPLRLGSSTYFESASGKILELQYNTESDGLCSCRKGTCPEQRCKCDKGHAQWEKDSGYIRYKQHLPITEMRILQSRSPGPQTRANLSLGPLNCWGEENSKGDTSVTFTLTSSYLRLKPWKSDSLQFMFRTHVTTAVILNQTQSDENSNSFVIALVSEDSVRFIIKIQNVTLEEIIKVKKPLSNGDWHFVSMEIDQHNIRCIVDGERRILDLPTKQVPAFQGGLYVGGYKNEVTMQGLKGCIKGFWYNNHSEALSRYVHPSIPGVSAGCVASCESSPCQNNGQCIEHWGSYKCICTNKWAHWGDSCERNINKDEITFDGTNSSYLDLEGFREDNLLDSTIILSFRTFQAKAILLYIYDSLNNFLQLELEKGDRLSLTFNHFKTVVSGTLQYRCFNDGEWKQIVIYQEENKESNFKFNVTKMFVNSQENSEEVPYSRVHLRDYTAKSPFRSETIKPPRSEGTTNVFMSEYYRLFVGGAPPDNSNIDNFKGCIRGLKIGNKVFSLQQEAHLRPAVSSMCQEGCTPNPCLHHGSCMERWGRKTFVCNCENTNFAGDICDIEASGNFSGKNVLEYNFKLVRKASSTTSEMLSLSFHSNEIPKKRQIILAVVMSAKHADHDLLMFILNDAGVLVKHYQQRVSHSLLVEGHFADGRAHNMQYYRSGGEMFLTVVPLSDLDNISKGTVPSMQTPLNDLDKIMLGGVVIDKLPFYIEQKEEFLNFTGCLSEVIFTPVTDEPYTYNPLKDLRSFANDSIIVHGGPISGCSIREEESILTTEPPTTTEQGINQRRTMPPWNPAPAETIYLNAPPPTTSTEALTITTTIQTPATAPSVQSTTASTSATERLNVTKAAIGGNMTGTATELEIMVALGIIVGLMLISCLIALVLCKKRRREKYVEKKKLPPSDLELKVPLTSIPPPSQKPYDHIARLDEFSMVSITLGPKKRKENGIIPGSEPLLCENDTSPTEYPVQSTFYNKKKNRPASSISEVLEEMERQRKEKESGESPEDTGIQDKSDELEWDPMNDQTPLTSVPYFETISEDFLYQMLPSPILNVMDDIEELSMESASTFGTLDSMKKQEDGESEGDPLQILEQQTDLALDTNGDSGYEAESHKDGGEDINNTPPTPEKMYMYDLTGQNTNTQKWTSTPNHKLVDYEESIT